jgi:UDP-N-acetylglucosamine 2-epimerase
MARVNNPFGDGRAAERIVSHIRQFLGANVDEPDPATN